jgi:hypothetical protein
MSCLKNQKDVSYIKKSKIKMSDGNTSISDKFVQLKIDLNSQFHNNPRDSQKIIEINDKYSKYLKFRFCYPSSSSGNSPAGFFVMGVYEFINGQVLTLEYMNKKDFMFKSSRFVDDIENLDIKNIYEQISKTIENEKETNSMVMKKIHTQVMEYKKLRSGNKVDGGIITLTTNEGNKEEFKRFAFIFYIDDKYIFYGIVKENGRYIGCSKLDHVDKFINPIQRNIKSGEGEISQDKKTEKAAQSGRLTPELWD